jgi:polygalacturonase
LGNAAEEEKKEGTRGGMNIFRRDFVKLAASGLAGGAAPLFASSISISSAAARHGNFFNVRDFGAAGNGSAIDSPAINRAIEAAAAGGGGTVWFPAGTYLSYSIRLKSHITLRLDSGATILSARVPLEGTTTGGYDAAESNAPWEAYQDFGHNHWHNSLIWGEGLEGVAICGAGLIWGKNLSRGGKGRSPRDQGLPRAELPGVANKAIALKNCRNVLLRDFSILQGGHIGILTTGVDNLTIDNLTIDTNRDGMDIDCCRNVRISNCSVNSPWDDGICLKSSYSLGYARATENVTISGCYLTGAYDLGTLLDGTFRKFKPGGKNGNPTGRIKFGTSSNGGFKNIAISSCVFDTCRGLALECVDGGSLEDVTITGITMRNVTDSPLFLRLGSRLKGPKGITAGKMRRILISNIVSSNCVSEYAAILSGVPGHQIEDIKISNVYLEHQGGGTPQMAALRPAEQEAAYPEVWKLGPMPAHGFFMRHVRNIELTSVEIAARKPDARPAMWLQDVDAADFFRLKIPRGPGTTAFFLKNCSQIHICGSRGIEDTSIKDATEQSI